MTPVRKAYVDGPYGQVHLRMTPPRPGTVPLVCLHATAYSSQSFLPLMQALGQDRQVIAIDAPGYGESDGPPTPLSMADYASATVAAVEQVAEGPIAVLGYHTGCYVATEMAIARPDLVQKLALVGIPYFQALDLDFWKARLTARHQLTERLDQFEERWAYFITNRHGSVSLERGYANFLDELKAWPEGWWAHEAMFAYDSDARLPLVQQPVLVPNPAGHLASASAAAARLFPHAAVVDLPEITGPVLECAPEVLARLLAKF